MNLDEFLKTVVSKLDKQGIRYALAGGLVASIYRKESRLTQDLDFLFYCEQKLEDKASKIISSFGLNPSLARRADLEGGPKHQLKDKSSPVYMLIGRDKNDSKKIGLDFILPNIPWFDEALERAQDNLIDFGFAKIPCLTVEDFIVAKLYALKNDAKRFKDLDDLQSIFVVDRKLDFVYLGDRMEFLGLQLPQALQEFAPLELKSVSKKIGKELRKKAKQAVSKAKFPK